MAWQLVAGEPSRPENTWPAGEGAAMETATVYLSPMDETPSTMDSASAPLADTPARLSMLAMGSLTLALIALVGGCGSMALAMMVTPGAVVAVMAAPLLGLIALVMGFLSLRRIERSQGELLGRPAGLAGLFLGLIAASVMGFMAMAAMLQLSGSATLAPVTAELVASTQRGKPAQARENLSETANADLTGAQLAAFGGATRRAGGIVTGHEAGMSLLFEAQRIKMQSQGSTSMSFSDAPRPVWLLLDDQRFFAYVFYNQAAVKEKKVRIDDILLFTGVNEVIVLREFGPAQVLADSMEWAITTP